MKPTTIFTSLRRVLMLALLVPISAAFATGVSNTATIAKLLDQAKLHAAQANDDAALLDSYARSGLTWQMHGKCLQNIKEHANDLLKDFTQLQAIREKGTPGQREAIDRLEPLLQRMAFDLTTTIRNLNENPTTVNMPSFRTRIHADWVSINTVYNFLCECTAKNYKT